MEISIYVKIVSDKSVALVGIFLFHVCVYFSLVLSRIHFLSIIRQRVLPF